MKFKYMRIQGEEYSRNTNAPRGIFSLYWELIQKNIMDEEDKDLYMFIDKWMEEELPFPPQCKNKENVICFFKTEDSKDLIKILGPAMWLLDKYGVTYYVVYTNSPGKILYEDEYQIVVEAGKEIKYKDSVNTLNVEAMKDK